MKKTLFSCLMFFCLVVLSACGANSVSSSKADGEVVATGSVSESTTDDSGQIVATTDTGVAPLATTAPLSDGLNITAPSNTGNYTSGYNWNVIRGTADADTVAIEVNGYRLQKYVPGSTEWNYIAASSMQTLQEGDNEYVIKAFDADDNVIDQISYHINYQANHALPNVGTSLNLILLLSFVLSFGLFIRRQRV